MSKYFIQDGMISKFDFMNNQGFYPLPTLCNMLNDNDEKYDKLAKKFVIVSKALELEREYMFKVMCADDVPSIEYFIEKAKEMVENE